MAEIGRRKGDDALLLALAAGKTVRDAARLAGIGERTATRRVADPAFRRRVAEMRADMVSRATGQLVEASTKAVDTLEALLTAQAESVRLGAARSILELGSKLRDNVEFGERLAALEAGQQSQSRNEQ
jgi:hypothetical protein